DIHVDREHPIAPGESGAPHALPSCAAASLTCADALHIFRVDAYERLKAARLQRESFSQAVRRLIPHLPGRAADFLVRARASDWGKQLDWSRVQEAYESRRSRRRG